MRVDDADFVAADSAINKRPRYTVEIDFGSGVKKYLTTHSDCEVPPGTAETDVLYRTLSTKSFSSISQTVDPLNATSSIGSMRIVVADLDESVTTLINDQRLAGRGERLKTVTVYVGYKGLTWDKYAIVQTQAIENISGGKGGYSINCADVQREARKKIFIQKNTTLTANISTTDITLPVSNVSNFETVFHGQSYGDSPNSTVGYVKIEDEIIRCTAYGTTTATVDHKNSTLSSGISIGATTINLVDGSLFRSSGIGYITDGSNTSEIRWAGRTSNQLTGVTGVKTAFFTGADVYDSQGRGALNTRAELHEVDLTASADRRTEVVEHIYLELPAPKLDYALRTGIIYPENGGPTYYLPDHWHAGISTSLISTASYLNLGNDLWDATDDTKGLVLRISGKKDIDAKSFIEKSIYQPAGLYPVVGVDAQLGVRRINRILADASYVEILDKTNIVSFGELDHGKDVQNLYLIGWNYDEVKEKNTRGKELKDQYSWDKYGKTEAKVMDFGLMHGSKTTISTIKNTFNTLRDRYAAPPLRLSVKCLHRMNRLDVGDIVKVDLTGMLRDLADSSLTFSRSMEIERKTVDWATGQVSFNLIGSAERAGVIVDSGSPNILSTSDYSSGHTALTTALTAAGITYTDISGVLTITGSGTLTGNASLSAGGNYYYLGDVVNNGDLVITDNVGLWVQGFITNNGTINGKGQGIPASATGTAGYVGSTKATGGATADVDTGSYNTRMTPVSSSEKPVIQGKYHGIPSLNAEYSSNGLTGILDDGRGSSGGAGGDVVVDVLWSYFGSTEHTLYTATGGAGGAGGASLRIVCQGISCGPSSVIDLSGEDGSPGGWVFNYATLYAGTGAGGAGGVLDIIFDGSDATITDVEDKFVSKNGSSETPGEQINSAASWFKVPMHSHFEGFPGEDHSQSNLRWTYIHDLRDPEEDVEELAAVPSAITIQEATATKSSLNIAGLEISVTPPSPLGNYYGARITASLDGTDSWADIGIVRSTSEIVYFVPADGSKYNFRAYPISNNHVESNEYLEDSFTVTNALKTIIGTNNTVQTSATVGAGTSGQGVIIDSAGQRGYNATGVVKYSLDATTGLLACTDANVSGTITATAGAIGNWAIATNYLTSGTGANTVRIDSGGINPAFSAGSATPASAPFRVTKTGALTATSATITGTITATAGAIGNWAINSGTMRYYDGIDETMLLDGSGERIQVGPSSGSYMRMDTTTGFTGIDNALGTVFRLPLDGTAPTFSSGIINSTIYNISTSGILRTSETVGDGSASSAGVLINDTGIKGYPASSSTPKFFLDAATGVLTSIGAIFQSETTGQRIEINPSSDNEIHFYGDRGDATVAELATIGITTIGTDNVIGVFGRYETGCSRVGVHGRSYTGIAIKGESYSIYGGHFTSQTGIALYGATASGAYGIHGYSATNSAIAAIRGEANSTVTGVWGSSSGGVGVVASTTGTLQGAFKITPKLNTTDPTIGAMGQFYVRSDGVLRFHDGTNWKTVTVV